ncbi:MAG: hypothetical protein WD069_11885 [Planctomycetales bacterium]
MKALTSLAGCLLGGAALLGTCRADEPNGSVAIASQPGTTIIYDEPAYGGPYGYPADCPPGGYASGHWHDQHLYPGVPRVAGTAARAAGGAGYIGMQGGYQVGKTAWRMLEGDPGYQGHWDHPHHVAQHGYGGAGGGNWGPQHRIFYTYHRPTDLRYPPPQVPAAVVQYPYYTNRGPTDFFMK